MTAKVDITVNSGGSSICKIKSHVTIINPLASPVIVVLYKSLLKSNSILRRVENKSLLSSFVDFS
jgi:hypothetical protein